MNHLVSPSHAKQDVWPGSKIGRGQHMLPSFRTAPLYFVTFLFCRGYHRGYPGFRTIRPVGTPDGRTGKLQFREINTGRKAAAVHQRHTIETGWQSKKLRWHGEIALQTLCLPIVRWKWGWEQKGRRNRVHRARTCLSSDFPA